MGMFGWGPKDETTKPERDAWKSNAKEQMNGGKTPKSKTPKDDGKPPRHANRSSWW